MSRLLNTLLILLMYSIAATSSYAQNLSHTRLGVEEGLPDNEVYSVFQDRNGFIWIGCDAGLFRYTGVKFIKYSSKLQQSRAVTGLTQSKSGRIYCYTFKGQIFYVENDSLNLLKDWNRNVSNIICDSTQNLWIASMNGLYAYNEAKNEWHNDATISSIHHPDSLYFAKNCINGYDNRFWFVLRNKVCCINKGSLNTYKVNFTNDNNTLGSYILFSSKDKIWLFSLLKGDIYTLQNNRFEYFHSKTLNKVLSDKKVTNVRQLPDGYIWLCTYSGVVKYNPFTDTCETYFPEYSFSDIIIDWEGQYWLSSPNSGLFIIPDLSFNEWNENTVEHTPLKTNKIFAHEQAIYFANKNGQSGLLNTLNGKIETFKLPEKADIENITYDPIDQAFYMTAHNYVYTLTNKAWIKGRAAYPPIKAFLHLPNKYILATSRGALAVDRISDDKTTKIITPNWSRDIAYNPNNKHLWIATNYGLLMLKDVNQAVNDYQVFLDSIQIISICQSQDYSNVYALTFDGNVFNINTNLEVHKLTTLPSNTQGHKIKYYNNSLYMATNKGLIILDLNTNRLTQIDKFFGLISNDVQAIEIVDNHLWIGTNKGIQRLPLTLRTNSFKPRVYLKQLTVKGKSIDANSYIELRHNQTLSFKAEAITYRSNGLFKLAYRIVTQDSTWHYYPANLENIEIPSIQSGNFVIEIKATDYWGVDSENIIRLEGNVTPPIWQRWWFYALVALSTLLLSSLVYLYYLAQARKKQKQEIERLQIENELRLSQQSALKAQMNPHFIFNVLNSIKGYIYENDKKNASLYLSRFSDLIRKILDMSSRQYVTIEEELEVTKLYVSLESMLLDEEFDFNISVAEDIDSYKLPALFIQPFIENAFKHGLRYKKGTKSLSITFDVAPNSEQLLVTITDNGIGREASEKINTNLRKGHQSFATSAINKRINLLNSVHENTVTVQIIDLFDNNGPTGTTVILKFTFNESSF